MFVTRASNRNGNAGRPYYKCVPCDKFLVFADNRGNDPTNPPCMCGLASKRQVAGKERKTSRGLFYVCRKGACDFYAPALDRQEQQISIEDPIITLLAKLCII